MDGGSEIVPSAARDDDAGASEGGKGRVRSSEGGELAGDEGAIIARPDSTSRGRAPAPAFDAPKDASGGATKASRGAERSRLEASHERCIARKMASAVANGRCAFRSIFFEIGTSREETKALLSLA